jgi:hypothetical protein
MNRTIGFSLVALLGIAISAQTSLATGQPLESLLAPQDVDPTGEIAAWVGRWNTEFANGIHEEHELRPDGTVTVRNIEQNWSCEGRMTFDGQQVTITYDNERIERWTPVGSRMVLEHWRPASQIPIQPALFGIGTREE